VSLSIDQRMAAVKNRSSGFDYMRFGLATSIILWHTVMTSYGPEQQDHLPFAIRVLQLAILPMFFTLSGFLVAGSFERSPGLATFFGLRILRIVPALAAEVTLSALILGPLLTVVPLRLYFTDPQFRFYFLNIVGDIHFYLPGMFPNNPTPDMVNMQLWTIPYELLCYIALGAIAIMGLIRRRTALLTLLIVAQVVFGARGLWGASLAHRVVISGNLLVVSFFYGVTIHAYREKIPYQRSIALLMSIIMCVCLSYARTRYLCTLPAAYLTIYLGLLNPGRLSLILSGDYSYGLYLYGFPLQQAVASISPALHHWYYNFAIAYPLAAICAAGSWWLLEKNALALRKYLPSKARSMRRASTDEDKQTAAGALQSVIGSRQQ
jgi:peptidoglycan/LPS O-acetylase OafA/YrhL